jgi:large subunit ribosomal protein L24
MAVKFKIKREDEVVVTTGRDKGKTGRVLRVLRDQNRAVVEGVNVVKRATKPSRDTPGGIIEKEASVHLSNLALADPKDGQPTKVGYKFLEDGRKVRFAKRSGEVIDV